MVWLVWHPSLDSLLVQSVGISTRTWPAFGLPRSNCVTKLQFWRELGNLRCDWRPRDDFGSSASDFQAAGVHGGKFAGQAIQKLDPIEAGKPYLVEVLIDPLKGASFDWLDDA